uniref:Xylose isomerase-like TIM barrel domain-containing protein n=1 Tax=Rhodosorus marinus TaxID=101924 RepID=A0A7S2ZH57_9RHOD|mmetsp:Transcript_18396/g.73788  ORF Transcript_18396/g.73788 Transcript_18396/m.73788 type:complete len:373 (+) Transcript_18396:364-1482(+)|eukprot:CAMPEP_0113960632 /NCGR_PEP_ID=MMETSP0011_2-20120614/4832_1 /TAXON_ID=101924 /ORGANISM="Rhodosorus marinus" /LENGTH=372 /DNA_ID=CAMNT_0000972125 /DNA_START=2677 /DNA_END=3795 /DNA_ORIENTATION=- /assembly_acc=CAM_ASM_000156
MRNRSSKRNAKSEPEVLRDDEAHEEVQRPAPNEARKRDKGGGKKRVKVEKVEKSEIKKKKSQVVGTLEKLEPEWLEVIQDRREKFPKTRLGAHVSAAGGVASAILRAAELGATAFAFFPRPHRSWKAPPMKEDEVERFKAMMQKCGYKPADAVPHGSYLINLATGDPTIREKSLECLEEEVSRCSRLGVEFYNFHPGSALGGVPHEKGLELVSEALNQVISRVENVVILIENMCGGGSKVGCQLEDLRTIVDKVVNKDRVGVCLDTCHAYAAGYDVSTEEGLETTVEEFDRIVGLNYLKAIHLNDSKGKLGCNADRHEKIGKGCIGQDAFQRIMNHQRLCHIPMILETPAEDRIDRRSEHSVEMDLLYSLTS